VEFLSTRQQGITLKKFKYAIYGFLFVLLFRISAVNAISQTLSSGDGELGNLESGLTYTLNPDPNAANPLTQYYGYEYGIPARFILHSNPSTRWRISFALPTVLLNNENDSIACSFSDSSSFDFTKQSFHDPRLADTIIIDSTGECIYYLGITASIPSISFCDREFSGDIFCSAMNLDDTTVLQTVSKFNCSIGYPYDAFNEGDCNFKNLSRGHTYSIDPESGEVYPKVNGMENGIIYPISQSCLESGAKIAITYLLPKYLVGNNGDSIPCTFSSRCAYDGINDIFFDPDDAYIFTLNDSRSYRLNLGMTVTIPYTAHSSYYSGYALSSCEYIGTFMKDFPAQGDIYFQVDIIDTDIPKTYILLQNFPNPFNPSTTISYGLPKSSHVTLDIFNTLGQQVASLVDENQNAGYHEVIFNGERLSSGVYFYQLRSNNILLTNNLVLVR
jgi:hypothetical protein